MEIVSKSAQWVVMYLYVTQRIRAQPCNLALMPGLILPIASIDSS
jgi:hypothetical protein